jgi:hypothetical protein
VTERHGEHEPGPTLGADLTTTDGELTLHGRERADELVSDRLVVEREREQTQLHRVQNIALLGLALLFTEALLLGGMAMAGTAAGWYSGDFALMVLAGTLAPSFGAGLIVLRWAFRETRAR